MKAPITMTNTQLIKWLDKTEDTIVNAKANGLTMKEYPSQRAQDLHDRLGELLEEVYRRTNQIWYLSDEDKEKNYDCVCDALWSARCDVTGSVRKYDAMDVWA